MSKDRGVVKDTSLPLGQIRDRISSSIISSVLDIQKYAVTRENWLRSLECLYWAGDNEEPSGKRRRVENGSVATGSSELLRRRYLDPVWDDEGGRDYVAVSYTWEPSKEEEEAGYETTGRYLVEPRKTGKSALPSEVRDVVWDRVLNYADHVGCENIWIDRECVNQDNKAEKEAAIQSMHLVYNLSRWPIALLTRVITTAEELDLLADLMCGEVSPEDEEAVLNLLDDITSNLWWTRAWTFQEDHKASTRMMLLIPHTRDLEKRKQAIEGLNGEPLLGDVEGEICIKSMNFRRKATEFCLSYRKRAEDKDICDKILKAAAQYNILLGNECLLSGVRSVSRSMSPTILSDILSRGIKEESDRLAIMANCCTYGTRLDSNCLKADGSSLSLSILALYLLNGEIIENDPGQSGRGTLNDNVYEYLSKQSLSNFRPPIDHGLTFIRNCRFLDPQLTPDGTQTKGHLWKLGKVIRRKPMKWEKYSSLRPLDKFATELEYRDYGCSYTDLAARLLAWAYENPPKLDENGRSYRSGWRGWMAGEVEEALMEGKVLRLGCLVHPKYGSDASSYRAVFVSDGDDDWQDETAKSYAFTSSRLVEDPVFGNTQRHVSLEVDVEWQRQEESGGRSSYVPPKLYIKRWLNGFCFFEGVSQRPVLFPWPAALLE
ncbi:hypothetical protein GGS26DRAFT_330424 [Hypomontagnella submonticulosa]|nr:hypothetical protein GGS26DRAFT_330424 [Hypomontagnella submonticulosa]